MGRIKYGNFRSARVKTDEGNLVLDLPEFNGDTESLPTVSVVTITKDRQEFIASMLFIWNSYIYPRDKLEWIIIDDSKTDGLRDYLDPQDERIKYHYFSEPTGIAEKRNKAVELATGEIIVHQDDDDFYFADSIFAKVRVIQEAKCQGVLSWELGVYDLINKKSFITSRPKQSNQVPEATLAYRKSYWETRKFAGANEAGTGEGEKFIGKRFHDWVNIHFLFNSVSITHGRNVTGMMRKIPKNAPKSKGDFRKVLPENYVYLLDNIRELQSV